MPIRLTFHGAASTVTGSCYLVEHDRGRFLVDCGLFQGTKTIRELNYGPFPFAAQSIDYVLLTHAHTDHAGLLPKLRRAGFKGADPRDRADHRPARVHAARQWRTSRSSRSSGSTGATGSAAGRWSSRSTPGATPSAASSRRAPATTTPWFEPGPGVRARYWNAATSWARPRSSWRSPMATGPPCGSCSRATSGRTRRRFIRCRDAPAGTDILLVESTYGDRDREDLTVEQRRDRLGHEIREALAAGGNLLIPAFAVERSQELLYDHPPADARRRDPRHQGVPRFTAGRARDRGRSGGIATRSPRPRIWTRCSPTPG